MANYAVGDIQGCATALQRLLAKAEFDANQDRLWFAGDLVNRGPDNLGVLRFARDLGDAAVVVLGNHDLHLLAVACESKPGSRKDTIHDILGAPDREELLTWLRRQPLIYREGNFVMSHAGVPHIWSADTAMALGAEVSTVLAGDRYHDFLSHMYGNEPAAWDDTLTGAPRLRTITNYLTRMRFVTAQGELDLAAKEGLDKTPENTRPWFDYPRKKSDDGLTFLFGHWAAIQGQTSHHRYCALDTGCVWGGCLSMLRLEDRQYFRVQCDER